MTTWYVGPERRQSERRQREIMNMGDPHDRRNHEFADRRQQALSGVIAGLTAKQMQELAKAWQALEGKWPPGVSS